MRRKLNNKAINYLPDPSSSVDPSVKKTKMMTLHDMNRPKSK